jgi:peptidoglycan/LPS O-acetylase OafA/YrhL
MSKIPVLTRRPRFCSKRSLKVKHRSPKINILKAIANGLTTLCAIACIGLMLYGVYIALPHIFYGIWLMLPCMVVAAIIALLGASFQAFLQCRERD